MPLTKFSLKPGITRESTSYANEGTWYDSDKVRFRFGHPEKIGGWTRFSSFTFLGVCRSLFNWVTLSSDNLLGVGTNLKFYINSGGEYFDITPLRGVATLTDSLSTVSGEARIYVYSPVNGATNGDFVTFSGFVGTLNGIPAAQVNVEHQITVVDVNNYYVVVTTPATSSGTPASTLTATYQINTGSEVYVASNGWGAGAWGRGSWGSGAALDPGASIRLWSQSNFGQDLLFNPRGGGIYYWETDLINFPRGLDITLIPGTDGFAPVVGNCIVVSDQSLQLLVFGANPVDSNTQDPLLIRWGDFLDPLKTWEITATSSAGDTRLSHGSRIITAVQSRQEILTWTDSSLYSLQYVGLPDVWRPNLLADNISIISPQCTATANNLTFWMGTDKFYVYSGRVDTLVSPVRTYVFQDINVGQNYQVFAGTNEGFNEVWWFYCSIAGPDGTGTVLNPNTQVDKYVIYNYVEQAWTIGSLSRSAWLDSPLQTYPLSAFSDETAGTGFVINQEDGVDDGTTNPPSAIVSYIQSADFSMEQGQNFGLLSRIIPDITFNGSISNNPQVNMTIKARAYPGSNYVDNPLDDTSVTRTATAPVEQYTNVVYVRVRGRQLALRIDSSQAGTAWQLGTPRGDIRPDGRR
jgi:hypothetical protein